MARPLTASRPRAAAPASFRRIYDVVSRIPRGRVATYGQVALLAGMQGQARLVGYALHALRDGGGVPWHRVLNARGQVSPRSGDGPMDAVQRARLKREGVRFDAGARVALERFRWRPSPRRAP